MARYVVGPDVALRLARESAVVRKEHELLAPTLIRTQVLSALFRTVQKGEMNKREATRCLDYIRGLRVRLLGDRSLQDTAWKVAERLGWSDTLDAEYVALAQLQADALITLDARLASAVKGTVAIAPFKALLRA